MGLPAMARKQTTLIIPVESQVRELDAKLLFACVAAERGYSAIIGSRGPINRRMATFPRGVFLAKGMRRIARKMFKILRGLGHEIVAWDEEAMVRFPREDYYRRRLSPDTIALVSHLLAWGDDDAEVLAAYPGRGGKPVQVTGNPRIDLLRPEVRGYFDPEVKALREAYGDFVLINTNFGFVNAFASSLNLLQEAPDGSGELVLGDNTKGMEPEFARGLAEHKLELFAHFRDLVPFLAESMPEQQFVVRPHPAEDHSLWRETTAHCPNVHVLNERSVVPWLIASRALIHNGCTTSVEAAVLGKPSIAFRPVSRKSFDFEFPNSLSYEAFDRDELLAALRAIAAGDLSSQDETMKRAILGSHIAALDGPLAADRMVSMLTEAGYDRPPPRPEISDYLVARYRLRKRNAVKAAEAQEPGSRNSQAYHDHRFPGITVEQIYERIRRFSDELGRFEGVEVEPVDEHIFRLHSRTPLES
jgi:surface carbohydrate biosynthesis protein